LTYRVLTAGPDTVAELYQNVPQGKRTIEVSLGRYEMPFQLTVTKQYRFESREIGLDSAP
jgi:hypothetical protein